MFDSINSKPKKPKAFRASIPHHLHLFGPFHCSLVDLFAVAVGGGLAVADQAVHRAS